MWFLQGFSNRQVRLIFDRVDKNYKRRACLIEPLPGQYCAQSALAGLLMKLDCPRQFATSLLGREPARSPLRPWTIKNGEISKQELSRYKSTCWDFFEQSTACFLFSSAHLGTGNGLTQWRNFRTQWKTNEEIMRNFPLKLSENFWTKPESIVSRKVPNEHSLYAVLLLALREDCGNAQARCDSPRVSNSGKDLKSILPQKKWKHA